MSVYQKALDFAQRNYGDDVTIDDPVWVSWSWGKNYYRFNVYLNGEHLMYVEISL